MGNSALPWVMKKCAYCGRENEEAANTCRECGKSLQELSAPDADAQLLDTALSPAVVATFSSLLEAKLLADRLEAAGIEADIPEEYASQVFSSVMPLELVSVQVAAKDYETARAIAAEPVAVTSAEVPGELSVPPADAGL